MTLWWAWWLTVLSRRKPAKPVMPKVKPKARRVPAYRRADGTDELRRIH